MATIELSDKDAKFLLYCVYSAAEYFDTVRDAHWDRLNDRPFQGYKRVHDEAIRERQHALRMIAKLRSVLNPAEMGDAVDMGHALDSAIDVERNKE